MRRYGWVWVVAVLILLFVAFLGYSDLNSGSDALTDEPDDDDDSEDTGDTVTNAITASGSKTLDPVLIVAAGVQHVEGWFPGSRSYRNNNPGNLRVTGATGQTGVDAGGYSIFANYDAGFDALLNDLQAKAEKHPTFSILDVFKRYAPSQDGNNPTSYAAQIVSDLKSALGTDVTGETNWSQLVDQYQDADGSA